jgi:predicted Zn-dependent peptidase
MITTVALSAGVTLRHFQTTRFKHGCVTIQFLRPMCREEAAMNALLPTVLLRGTEKHPDLQAITRRLDDLYGASVGDLVRRVGDVQATGLGCTFTEDRFALEGDRILGPTVDFLRELLLEPRLEEGIFCRDYVESEKRNRLADIESEFNDKRLYAANSLMRIMAREDSFGIPRVGDKEDVTAITPEGLYAHYRRILREAPVEIFYVGSADEQTVTALFRPFFDRLDRRTVALPPTQPLKDVGGERVVQESGASQSILNMGFVTAITNDHPDLVPMRLCNAILGGTMTSKLFVNIREKQSLCYSIGSEFYSAKGIFTVAAGIDARHEQTVRREVLAQLEACRKGEISEQELAAAKEAMLSALRNIFESPGAIERHFSTRLLSGATQTLEELRQAVERATVEDVARAASTLEEHSTFFLKGVG